MALDKDSMDYNVPEYDLKSVIEIKKRLKKETYKDTSEVREHLQFLETLHNKLKRILEQERRDRMGDLDTEKFFVKVKKTYDELYAVYEKLLEEMPKKEKSKEEKKPKKPLISGFRASSYSSRGI